MPIQTGAHSLTNGATVFSVTFPTPYVSAPETVLPAVQNLSADVTKLLIDVGITEITNVGFSGVLSQAPNSGNYELSWWAGGPGELAVVLNYVHQRIDRQPLKNSLDSNDRLVGVDMSGGIPRTLLTTVGKLDERWLRRQVTPPTAPNSPGLPGDISGDDTYAYFRTASAWVRLPLILDSVWASDYSARPTRRGVVSLNNSSAIQEISFSEPFSGGSAPIVTCQVQNLSADSGKLLIHAMPIASSLTAFSVALSGVPDSGAYQLSYEAFQN